MHTVRSRSTGSAAIVLIGIVGILVSIAVPIVLVVISARSACIAAEAGIKAQFADNQNIYDNAWKDVREEAQVTAEFVSANKDLLRAAVEGRRGASGELVRVIRESNPTLDTAVFIKVQRAVETAHARFAANQTALTDRTRAYEVLYQSPSVMIANLFVSPPFPRIKLDDYKIVTSSATEKAFSTGKADEIDVFGRGRKLEDGGASN